MLLNVPADVILKTVPAPFVPPVSALFDKNLIGDAGGLIQPQGSFHRRPLKLRSVVSAPAIVILNTVPAPLPPPYCVEP